MVGRIDARYAVCDAELRRFILLDGMTTENTRCVCGGHLIDYTPPPEISSSPPSSVSKDLQRFWLAGRETGYWGLGTDYRLLPLMEQNHHAAAAHADGKSLGERHRRIALRQRAERAAQASRQPIGQSSLLRR